MGLPDTGGARSSSWQPLRAVPNLTIILNHLGG
jgi:hypothetical protein